MGLVRLSYSGAPVLKGLSNELLLTTQRVVLVAHLRMTQCLYFVIFEAAGWGRHFFVAASSAQCYLLVVVVLGSCPAMFCFSLMLCPTQARLAMFGRSTNFFTVAAHTPYTWPLPAVLGKMVLTRQSFKSQGSFWPSFNKGYVIYRPIILLTSSNNQIYEFRIPNIYNEIFVLIFFNDSENKFWDFFKI